MAPVDSASLAIFRMGLGAVVAWEAWRYIADGAVRRNYLEPDFHFTWWAFDWVKPHDFGTYLHFAAMGVAAVLLAIGLFYRWATVVTFLGCTYFFLLDKAYYLNHRYLACLFLLLLAVVPAHSAYSADARRKPWVSSPTVPAWTVALFRFQVGVPYFFAGIAKLNFDWLFRAEPLREWLLDDSDFPLIGGLFAYEPVVYAMAIGSTLLDLASPFLLLHRRTRTAVYGLTLAFHFMNSRLFGIGIFPWMMIVATTLFFDADWPRRFIASLRSGRLVTRLAIAGGFAIGFAVGGLLPDTFSYFRASVGGFGVAVFVFHALPGPLRQATHARPLRRPTPWQRFRLGPALAWFLAIWVAVQLLLPLRHWLYPGNHNWTDEGHRFAWNLLVRQKRIVATFIVTDPATDETWTVSPSGFLNPFQVGRVTTYPDIALQFAHHVERYYREQRGLGDLEVRVRTFGWLNTREPQELIRPNVDLTKVDRPYISPADWIAPLEPY